MTRHNHNTHHTSGHHARTLHHMASSDSNASDSLIASSSQPRLSRISRNARHAVALNQIHHVEIHPSARSRDGAALFVVDVFLRPYQTGIPDVRMSAEFIDEHLSHKGKDNSDPLATGDHELPLSPQSRTERATDSVSRAADGGALSSFHLDTTTTKHTAPPQPHYQIEYRYSSFRKLRKALRATVEDDGDYAHAKWCGYCANIQWLTTFSPFPSRHPFVRLVTKRLLCRDDFEQGVLERLLKRSRKLTSFVNRVVHSAKDASYRYQSRRCDCYARVSSVVTAFLAEPHAHMASSGSSSNSGGGGACP